MPQEFSYLSIVSTGSAPTGDGAGLIQAHVLNTSNPWTGGGTLTGNYIPLASSSNFASVSHSHTQYLTTAAPPVARSDLWPGMLGAWVGTAPPATSDAVQYSQWVASSTRSNVYWAWVSLP